ncbi:MAG: LPS export ABC transporter periplasmic protein LptC [Betaproteobacteria bacterium RIFCSPLOWO2_12_FULL_62_13]|nr:MAG: LPS export ABC transporter periplasmic protein LptC [Betaproteobacteria bacterium RIFCSPLOWO2_12_FULL_62_13]
MNERLTAWFPLLLLSALAALTFWLDRFVQPPASTRGGVARHDPDYIVDGLSAVRMAADGAIKHTLFAEKMVHYPDDDSTRLDSPRYVSYAAAQAPVTITAREALVSSEGENIYFRDDVLVKRAPYANKSELTMRTSYLHVIPDDNIARTDRAVTITDANTVVTAVGLELNNETRVLKLLSRVKGTYHDPNRRPPRAGG